MKLIKTDDAFIDAIMKGVNTVVNLVSKTLGGKGRSIMLDTTSWVHTTLDGITITRNSAMNNKDEDMGLKLVLEAGEKQDRECGDGTSTVQVVLQSLMQGVAKAIKNGADRQSINKGIISARNKVIEEITSFAQKITRDSEEAYQVAKVSAHGDEEVAKLVADIFKNTNKHSAISVEESRSNESYIDIIDGMKVNSGWLSQEFITNGAKETAELENPFILIYKGKINNVPEIFNILKATNEAGRPLVIVSDSMEGETLSTLSINVQKGQLSLVAINPAPGHDKKTIINRMKDLAASTGATLISPDFGHNISDTTLDQLGTAKRVIVSKTQSVFYEGGKNEEVFNDRVKDLEQQLDDSEEGMDRQVILDRLASLTGGVGVIYVGGNIPTEVKEKRDRVDDAKGAVESALELGIVPGGGTSLLFAANVLEGFYLDTNDENIGVKIVKEALTVPIKQILLNAGLTPEVIIHEIKKQGVGYGYNVMSDEHVNLIDDGILDSAKVEINAIMNATAVAVQFANSVALITNVDKID